jgi:hypothetical protein
MQGTQPRIKIILINGTATYQQGEERKRSDAPPVVWERGPERDDFDAPHLAL